MSSTRRRRVRAIVPALLAVLFASVLTALVPVTASGDAVKGSLAVISVSDGGTGLAGAVQGRPFTVVVESRDDEGAPLPLTRATTVELSEVSGAGTLSGTLTGVIPKNGSQATISGAVYSALDNGVVLRVTAISGVALSPGDTTVNVASTAFRAVGSPRVAQNVTDPGCAIPTPASPVCGYLLLPNGANGTILLSVGSCEGILDCATDGAGLVTADVVLKDELGQPLYTRTAPATFVVACDKSLCGNGGVPSFDVLFDVTNTEDLTVAPPCPAKGVIGDNQDFCHDTVQSKKDGSGDLYSYILFVHDARASFP
jgi:hypothetical protein